jgi:sporulation protein YlmC with PRC-barrel domain
MATNRESRDLRDQAGVGPDAREARHLHPLSELDDCKIASGEPDIRGWEVFTSAGRDLGKVEDLLVDPTIGQVVMLDIDVEDSNRRALAPIKAAWIDRENERVVLDGAQISDDELLPSLSRDMAASPDENRSFRDRYARTYGDRGWNHDSDWRVRHANEEIRLAREAREESEEREERRQKEERKDEREREKQHAAELERDRRDREALEHLREVRYSDEALQARRPQVVEETVVRRRVIDPAEAKEPPRQ